MTAHPVSTRLYFAVFGALLALTAVTTAVAFYDLGALNTVVALGIASVKAMLVVLYFMHVRWSNNVVRIFACVGLLFLLILFTFTVTDYSSRPLIAGWQ